METAGLIEQHIVHIDKKWQILSEGIVVHIFS